MQADHAGPAVESDQRWIDCYRSKGEVPLPDWALRFLRAERWRAIRRALIALMLPVLLPLPFLVAARVVSQLARVSQFATDMFVIVAVAAFATGVVVGPLVALRAFTVWRQAGKDLRRGSLEQFTLDAQVLRKFESEFRVSVEPALPASLQVLPHSYRQIGAADAPLPRSKPAFTAPVPWMPEELRRICDMRSTLLDRIGSRKLPWVHDRASRRPLRPEELEELRELIVHPGPGIGCLAILGALMALVATPWNGAGIQPWQIVLLVLLGALALMVVHAWRSEIRRRKRLTEDMSAGYVLVLSADGLQRIAIELGPPADLPPLPQAVEYLPISGLVWSEEGEKAFWRTLHFEGRPA